MTEAPHWYWMIALGLALMICGSAADSLRMIAEAYRERSKRG